uniref:Uncharacterized protein n=2 Tax=Oryza TaxID=4527 RepID=Q6ZLG0_ORYSJ|nr:hypothetical protein [Oryza sativa Japonica Group]
MAPPVERLKKLTNPAQLARRRHGRAGRWWLTRSSGRDAHDESSRVAATAEAADRPSAAGACSCCCLRTGSRQPGACCCSPLRDLVGDGMPRA